MLRPTALRVPAAPAVVVAWRSFLLFLVFLAPFPAAAAAVEPLTGDALFRDRIEPLLQAHCLPCHSHAAGKMKGGLTLDSRAGWEQGGEHGPALVRGQPDVSRLIQAVRRIDGTEAMPPKDPLPREVVETLVDWVRQGAPDPRTAAHAPATPDSWWAVQPIRRPAIPAGPGIHPIDALAKPAPVDESPPDKRTLLRRLMVDLHGILPTPEELAEFEADSATDAFERQVDRLLASPRYGERWARHWLDVAHFAETHGHDQDRPRESAWRYRDYLINAFNTDRPYARFVMEQIAADALFPDEPALTPALGFLAAGPWDESSLRDIREDVLDREIGRYLDRDDIVANAMSTFASVTVHCARCHDHKFDPIPQRDYFALQAVFAGTEKAERLYDEDPAVNRLRTRWMRLQIALDRRDAPQVDELLTPGLRTELAAWETSAASRPTAWAVLSVDEIETAASTDLRPQPDGSLLASGANPATNTYTLNLRLPDSLTHPTAVRLELLPDDAFPARGPGRAANGNLHLTDFKVFAAAPGAAFQRVPLSPPTADFNQEGWDIARAIDSDPATGWGIHPQEGRPHVAVFELAGKQDFPPGTRLRFVLGQDHGRQHTIGRFRLGVTGDAPPVRAVAIPDAVLAALAAPVESRTAAQRFELTAFFLAGRPARELAALPEPSRVFAGASVFPPNAGQKAVTRPRPIHLLRRGEISKPLELATPGALSCIPQLPSRFDADFGTANNETAGSGSYVPEEARRRAALARWMAHPDNPLVWRSIVNRAWHHHFGRGIVDTPNDFGRMGGTPASPELLDGLAVLFRDDLRGSLKQLHRLILTSRTWRQSAADPLSARPLQPLRRRLDAETFRDSLLRMSGRLDDTPGGPSVKQFAMSAGIHVTPNVDYTVFDPDAAGSSRRSIYRFLFRTLPDPLMDTLDSPAGDQSAPVRGESFTALQAFALLNHPFVVRQSEHLGARLTTLADTLPARVDTLCRIVWQRDALPSELVAFTEHARRHGLPHLCRLLINSNEFHFID